MVCPGLTRFQAAQRDRARGRCAACPSQRGDPLSPLGPRARVPHAVSGRARQSPRAHSALSSLCTTQGVYRTPPMRLAPRAGGRDEAERARDSATTANAVHRTRADGRAISTDAVRQVRARVQGHDKFADGCVRLLSHAIASSWSPVLAARSLLRGLKRRGRAVVGKIRQSSCSLP